MTNPHVDAVAEALKFAERLKAAELRIEKLERRLATLDGAPPQSETPQSFRERVFTALRG